MKRNSTLLVLACWLVFLFVIGTVAILTNNSDQDLSAEVSVPAPVDLAMGNS